MRLKDRVAIVTGSGRGIGKATALQLSQEGARVVVSDVEFNYAEKVVEEIQNSGGKAFGVKCNVSVLSEIQAMVNTTIQEFGQIDILVNNAGGGGGDLHDAFLKGLSAEVIESVLSAYP